MYNILVVSAYPERQEKYDHNYTIIPAIWWEDITDDQLLPYQFYYNARKEHRKKVVACSLSHKKAIQHIIDKKLTNTIIIEDDALVDLDRLDELKDYTEFTYIGGDIRSPKLKDDRSFDKSMIIKHNGKNEINTKEFRILGAFGYYIPNLSTAKMIIENLPVDNKEKAFDVELCKLQKKKYIKYYHYPPLSKLYMKDALTGFNAKAMRLNDNFSEY